MSLVKRHPLITFFVLTYVIAWGLIPFWTFQAGAPFIAALIVIPLTQGLSGLKELGLRMIRWRVRWYWYVVAIALPLAVVLLTAGLNVALGASAPSLAGVGSVTTVLMMFAVRLVNPGDGALGEEPGWRGFALPGLQSTLSPLVSTLILGVLVTGWHVPLLFVEDGLLQPSIIVGFLLGTMAVTFWYTWMFNHTGGSVLITLLSHAAQGTIQESLARPCACAGDDDTTGDAAQRSGTSSACLARSLRLQGARLWEEPSTSCLGSSLPLFTLLPGKKENSAKFECKILYSPYPSCWGSDSSPSNAF
jgi:membrane protease YdiL (CAAX protease family)